LITQAGGHATIRIGKKASTGQVERREARIGRAHKISISILDLSVEQ
jgi:hypothetical protein